MIRIGKSFSLRWELLIDFGQTRNVEPFVYVRMRYSYLFGISVWNIVDELAGGSPGDVVLCLFLDKQNEFWRVTR